MLLINISGLDIFSLLSILSEFCFGKSLRISTVFFRPDPEPKPKPALHIGSTLTHDNTIFTLFDHYQDESSIRNIIEECKGGRICEGVTERTLRSREEVGKSAKVCGAARGSASQEG